MYQTKVMSSPVKVRAQTEPGKDEGDKPTTEKTAAGKKRGGGSEKSACHPPQRARMDSGVYARSRLN